MYIEFDKTKVKLADIFNEWYDFLETNPILPDEDGYSINSSLERDSIIIHIKYAYIGLYLYYIVHIRQIPFVRTW